MECKTYFDNVASQWDTMRQSFFAESVREKAFAVAYMDSGKLCADIGAGTGFITEGLIQNGFSVIAIDQSDEMLDEMKRKFSDCELIDYKQGTAENLPLEDASVDYVFANMYLHHVDDPQIAINEMTRVIKDSGKLVITDLDEHDFEFHKTEHFDRWMGFKREDVRAWFQNAGLKSVTVDCTDSSCCTSSSCGCGDASISIFVATGVK